ncbi:MAG: zinc-ribbon domain-containing protein [Candidatus Hodarchaeota archaeon]
MATFNDYPRKCVKCKRDDVEVHEFKHRKSSGTEFSSSHTTFSITFPVCDGCEQEFKEYLKVKDKATTFMYAGLCMFIPGAIIGALVLTVNKGLMIVQYIVIAAMAVLLGISLFFFIASKNHPHRIGKFIELTKDGRVIIQDEKLREEVTEAAVQKMLEKSVGPTKEETVYCPWCGKPTKKGTRFCLACGKDLSLL